MAQHRVIGPVRGVDTTRPPLAGRPGEHASDLATRALATVTAPADVSAGMALARQHACVSCHALDHRVVGPSFKEIAARYRNTSAAAALVSKMKAGGAGTWGPVPMPPQAHVGDTDLQVLARWILAEIR
jgi:cytochrome c